MTYWQSKGYIEAVFPAMKNFTLLRVSGVAEKMFPDKKPKKGKKLSFADLGDVAGLGFGGSE